MKLSILIPSLHNEERIELLARLKAVLYPQRTDEVEILILIDGGKATTGAKRNMLLNDAVGDYIVFVDDDDMVSENYVSLILDAIKTYPDVVGINLRHFVNGTLNGNTKHSIIYNDWKNIPGPDGVWEYQRCPNHLNPVKRELALLAGFPDVTIGEDKSYSLKLRPHLKTEVMIEEPIYYYMQRV